MEKYKRGFTLVELSIVLVIIGLVVGGVLVGRTLIQSAAIRSTVGQLQQISTAVHTFETKYDCVPGDCANASALNLTQGYAQYAWMSVSATGDGDGNGFISQTVQTNHEKYTFWLELRNANLTSEAAYRPCASGNEPVYAAATKVENASITPYSTPARPLNYLRLSTYNQWCESYQQAFALTTATAFAIDSKIDDGLPNTEGIGMGTPPPPTMVSVQGWMWTDACPTCGFYFYGDAASDGSQCSDSSVTPHRYNLANTSPALCTLLVQIQ